MSKHVNETLNSLPLPDIEVVLADPAASYWLKNGLRAALLRDPVDAANDAEILAQLLQRRLLQILETSKSGAITP